MPISPRPRTFRLAGFELDLRATVALVATTLLLTLERYHNIGPATNSLEVARQMAVEGVVYYLVLPLAIVILVFGESPRAYGLHFGEWRLGLRLTAVIGIVVLPLVAFAARTTAMQTYYGVDDGGWLRTIPWIATALLGWEFLFRGFLLFALLPLMGPTAIVAQAVPFAVAHLGKPEIETLTTIVGGSLFGWVAWRTRSMLYPFMIHLAVYALTAALATKPAP